PTTTTSASAVQPGSGAASRRGIAGALMGPSSVGQFRHYDDNACPSMRTPRGGYSLTVAPSRSAVAGAPRGRSDVLGAPGPVGRAGRAPDIGHPATPDGGVLSRPAAPPRCR